MRIDCLNAAAQLPATPTDDRVLTVDELARQFRVSTKTVCRWRRFGLVSRRFLLDGPQAGRISPALRGSLRGP